jgi:hypothetical protein
VGADLYWSAKAVEKCYACDGTGRRPCGECKVTTYSCQPCYGTGELPAQHTPRGSYALMAILRKKYHIDCAATNTLNPSDIPYLEGLRDANVTGTNELIEAINKHGEIEIGCNC